MSQGKLYTTSLNFDDDKKGEPLYGGSPFVIYSATFFCF